ncbi:MAG: 2'-5' RNA ligase family protein [Naasia sp.]
MPDIELRLDGEADAAIRAQWSALSDADLPSQADHAGDSNAPHVTAAFWTAQLEPFRVETPTIDIVVGSLLMFRRKRGVVLARQVVVNRELLDWHAEVHARLADDLDVDPRTRPGAWTPHVTLARSIPSESVPAALDALGPFADLTARVASVLMWNGRTATLSDLAAVPPSIED